MAIIIYPTDNAFDKARRKITHRDDGGTRRAGEMLDDLPIGLLDGWGVWGFRRVRGVRLRGRRGGFGTRCIKQQLDARFTTVVITAHMLPEARPSPGGPRGSGYRSVPNFALAE